MQTPITTGWAFVRIPDGYQYPVWVTVTGPPQGGKTPVNIRFYMGREEAESRYSSYVEACRRDGKGAADRAKFVEYMASVD